MDRNNPNLIAMNALMQEVQEKADGIVRDMKSHLNWVNSQLPPDQRFTLRVCGHSMGGAIASYVGAKNELPFTTFNGMALGSGLLQDIGEEKLQSADNLGGRYVVQRDWVADRMGGESSYMGKMISKFEHTRHLGQGYMIPVNPDDPGAGEDRHNSVSQFLINMIRKTDG